MNFALIKLGNGGEVVYIFNELAEAGVRVKEKDFVLLGIQAQNHVDIMSPLLRIIMFCMLFCTCTDCV